MNQIGLKTAAIFTVKVVHTSVIQRNHGKQKLSFLRVLVDKKFVEMLEINLSSF